MSVRRPLAIRQMPRSSSAGVTVSLRGGFANQLFGWATGWSLAEQFGVTLRVDDKFVSRFGNRGNQLLELGIDARTNSISTRTSKGLWRLLACHLNEKHYNALNWRLSGERIAGRTVKSVADAEAELRNGRRVHLIGYLQNPEVIESHRDVLRDKLRPALDRQLPAQVRGEPYAVAHVRRGDYLLPHNQEAGFRTCSLGYYLEALTQLSGMSLYAVTDDPQWVLDELRPALRARGNDIVLIQGSSHFADMATIANASAIVMSNSTFSWWGQFLSHSDEVFSPTPWFEEGAASNGLHSPTWIYLPRDL